MMYPFPIMDDMTMTNVPAGGLPDHLYIRLFSVMKLTIDRWWNAAHVRSSYWRLYVNSRAGAAVVTADGRPHALPARRVVLIPAWVHFSCRCTAAAPHFFCHFDVLGWPGRLVRDTLNQPVTLPADPCLHALARATIRGCPAGRRGPLDQSLAHPPAPAILRAKALATLAVALLLEQLPPASRAALSRAPARDERIDGVLRQIEARPGGDWSIAALARLCHLSGDHFARRFRALTGQTPAQYVNERRLVRAAEMLAFTSDKIDAIAQTLGYTDRFYFSRAFKRVMHISPARYRLTQRA